MLLTEKGNWRIAEVEKKSSTIIKAKESKEGFPCQVAWKVCWGS